MASAVPIPNLHDLTDSRVGQIRPGNTVRTGENRYPVYRVIATSGDRAWIRDLQYGTDHIVSVATVRAL